MSKNNDVFQVLVTSGNQAPLIINKRLEDLLPGQIGVFNARDNTSVTTATNAADARQFYLAVGLDRDGDTTMDDVQKSSGIIQTANIIEYTARCYEPGQPQITDITGFSAKCDTDYFVKVGVRNQVAYANYGFNYPFKTFAVHTSCCSTECGGCPEGDCTELATLLVNAINADPEAIFTANAFVNKGGLTVSTAPTADGTLTVGVGTESFDVDVLDADTVNQTATKIAAAINDVATSLYYAVASTATVNIYRKVSVTGHTDAVTFAAGTSGAAATLTPDFAYLAVSDIPAFKAANPGVCLGIRITGAAQGIKNYFNTNLDYQFPRGSALDVILGQADQTNSGFSCNGTVTNVQDPVFEEGSGYDIAHLEYIAGGWNDKPGPYRQSALVGESIGNYDQFAVKTGKYVQINITSEQESDAGWNKYKNRLNTTIAIPCGETTTLAGLLAILDAAITSKFGPLAADIAACPSCTTVKTTAAIDDRLLDGIG